MLTQFNKIYLKIHFKTAMYFTQSNARIMNLAKRKSSKKT